MIDDVKLLYNSGMITLKEFKSFAFSGGEVHVELPLFDSSGLNQVIITTRVEDSYSVMELLMITDAIRRRTQAPIFLVLPYLPYARQDHISTVGESLSLKVFADLLNSQKYAKVICYDAHSEVAKALINNLKVISQETVIGYVCGQLGISLAGATIVSPDFGATKKIGRLCSIHEVGKVIQADKARDLKTGKITGIEVYCDDLGGQDVIIIDDIIDGGATFVALAEALHKKNCGLITLYATHGIFAKGSMPLIEAGIDQIITTDTITPKELFGVTVTPVVGKIL